MTRKMKKLSVLIVASLLFQGIGWAQDAKPTFDTIYQRKMPAWFNEAKFGVFIVWGIYSVPGWAPKGEYAEWYGHRSLDPGDPFQKYHEKVWGKDFTYGQFVPMLTGEGFNADEWTTLIQKSGAKYVVTCANYHDGFAMYPTKYSVSKFGDHWNAFDRSPKRDVIGELQAAGTSKGLKMGIYYSLYEWWNPLYQSGPLGKYVRDFLQPKFKEVVTRYKPPVIFLDGEWEHPYQAWHSEELANWLYTESPVKDEVVVNDRWGHTRSRYGDYFSSEYGGGDYSPAHPWQEDRGIGMSYGYNRNENSWDYNSRKELLRLLSTICANGGNLLLDIGPTGDGRIPVIMQDRLLEMGKWLKVNGEAIYGTRYAGRDCQWSEGKRPGQEFGEYKVKYDLMQQIGQAPKGDRAVKQIFFTKKPGALYAITPGWPGAGLVIRNIKVGGGEPAVTLLGYAGKLSCGTKGNDLVIPLPNFTGDELPCQHAYVFKIPGA